MNPILAIRKSLTLKVAAVLAAVIVVLTAIAGYVIVAREVDALEALTLDKARLAATSGARAYGSMLEEGIESGFMRVADVFDREYQPIKGYDWGDKPRFHTKYDFFTDARVTAMQEMFMQQPDLLYAVGADDHGYVPTHNLLYQAAVTGDAKVDLKNNRTKRIFDEAVPMAAVRSEAPFLIQPYVRDTGQRAWDVSAPISVKGKHWGAFRIGVSVEEIAKLKTALTTTLFLVFLLFGAVSVGVIAFMVRQSMRPLVELAELANEISTGDKLDQPIKAKRIDEIGRMTKSVERLRASLKAAMAQIGE